MKQFISFIRKEFFHIFRDRRTMLILLGMPIVQIILFGFAITTEVKNVRVAVLDPSNDVVTRRIIDRMDASEYFTVIRRLHSPADMEASFGRGEIDMALVFSERFSDKLYTGEARVQLVSDATDPNMATMQAGYAANIISSAGQEMLPPGVHAAAIVPQLKLLYNPQMKSAYNFVPGVTKSRHCKRAYAFDDCSMATDARGEAPKYTALLVRVCCTINAIYWSNVRSTNT